MLKEIIEKELFCFYDGFSCWQEAIRGASSMLVEKKIIDETYVERIIDNVKEFGPYIVIMPEVAIPHSTVKAEGVYDTAIGFMKCNKPVVFESKSDKITARLFFTIASTNSDKHLENIQMLVSLLSNDGIVEDLLKCNCKIDLLEVIKKYDL